MAVTAPNAPAAPTAPSVPSVTLAPTHGGGAGSGDTEFATTVTQQPVQERPARPAAPQRNASADGQKTAGDNGAAAGNAAEQPAAAAGQQQAGTVQTADAGDGGQQTQTSLGQQPAIPPSGSSLAYWPFLLVFAVAFLAFTVMQAKKRQHQLPVQEKTPAAQPSQPQSAAGKKTGKNSPGSHFEVRI